MAKEEEEDITRYIHELVQSIHALVQTIMAQTQTQNAIVQMMAVSHQDHEQRLREVERSSTIMKERIGVSQMIQAAFTTVAAVLAGWFGSNK